jgi:ABC-type bacteriocin/lantibiotic exporter with double-glycine peptidase domain
MMDCVQLTETAAAEAIVAAPKIDVRDLEFFYGKSRALNGISLAVPANAVTAIIGPSGCGKSTLLRTINRIYEIYPDQRATGGIWIDGRNVLDRRYPLAELRRRVGMVFQKATPFATTNCYHQTCDAWAPTWDLRGAAQEAALFYAIGARLANSREWPQWNASSEFAKVRAQSAAVRGQNAGKGERGR